MAFIIAETFMRQLKRLPQKDQGIVSRTVLDLEMDPTARTLSLHRVDGNGGWWSAYANGDLRIILKREGDGGMILCWTDHHDKAYLWASRHVLTEHPVTHVMQIVEIPEVTAESPITAPITEQGAHGAATPKKTLCDLVGVCRDDLLAFGVPEAWIERVMSATDEDELLDIGQRIIRFSFPWKPHGIDLRGRSRVLKVNYRTTQEIRSMADRLTNLDAHDADDISQNREGTVSLLSGPQPEIQQFKTQEEEEKGVAKWIDRLVNELNVPADQIAIFYRSENEYGRAVSALERSVCGNEQVKPRLAEMFEAKGLKYRAAVVMACDSGVIPSPDRLAEADLIAGLEEIYDTERNLLYVACTRARDYLLITSSGTPSELLLDMAVRGQ